MQAVASQTSIGVQTCFSDVDHDHQYVQQPSFRGSQQFSSVYVLDLEKELHTHQVRYEKLQNSLQAAKENVKKLEKELAASSKKMTISDISGSDALIKLYTGIPSYAIFQWLFSEVALHAENLHYFKGKASFSDKSYQIHNHQKPGPKRAESLEDAFDDINETASQPSCGGPGI